MVVKVHLVRLNQGKELLVVQVHSHKYSQGQSTLQEKEVLHQYLQSLRKNLLTSIEKEILIDKELTIEEICTLLPKTDEKQLITIIQYLFDNDRVGKFGNKYQWKSN